MTEPPDSRGWSDGLPPGYISLSEICCTIVTNASCCAPPGGRRASLTPSSAVALATRGERNPTSSCIHPPFPQKKTPSSSPSLHPSAPLPASISASAHQRISVILVASKGKRHGHHHHYRQAIRQNR